jgi:hypothetical protein
MADGTTIEPRIRTTRRQRKFHGCVPGQRKDFSLFMQHPTKNLTLTTAQPEPFSHGLLELRTKKTYAFGEDHRRGV